MIVKRQHVSQFKRGVRVAADNPGRVAGAAISGGIHGIGGSMIGGLAGGLTRIPYGGQAGTAVGQVLAFQHGARKSWARTAELQRVAPKKNKGAYYTRKRGGKVQRVRKGRR